MGYIALHRNEGTHIPELPMDMSAYPQAMNGHGSILYASIGLCALFDDKCLSWETIALQVCSTSQRYEVLVRRPALSLRPQDQTDRLLEGY